MTEKVIENKRSKLSEALSNVVLENLNQDIQSMIDHIAELPKSLDTITKEQLSELKIEVESLHLALKSVPETFDSDFSKKMNKILDVLLEVDLHSTKLNKTLQNDNSEFLTKTASKYASEFNSRTEDYQRIRFWEFLLYGFVTVTLGGLISGLFMWVVFPKIF